MLRERGELAARSVVCRRKEGELRTTEGLDSATISPHVFSNTKSANPVKLYLLLQILVLQTHIFRMDHSHHAGMDMPSHGPKCNMNVSHMPFSPQPLTVVTSIPDAIHLGHDRPLHHLPTMAHLLHLHPPPLPRRRRPAHRWIRVGPRSQQTLRIVERGIHEQSSQ